MVAVGRKKRQHCCVAHLYDIATFEHELHKHHCKGLNRCNASNEVFVIARHEAICLLQQGILIVKQIALSYLLAMTVFFISYGVRRRCEALCVRYCKVRSSLPFLRKFLNRKAHCFVVPSCNNG